MFMMIEVPSGRVRSSPAMILFFFLVFLRGFRKKMYSHGILSVNAIPELVFRRADREGWKNGLGPAFRLIAEISPLSATMWAWMVMEDIRGPRFSDLFPDLAGLSGAVRRFGPARLGDAVWLVSFALAAACWFGVWAPIAPFPRGRPPL